MEESTNYKLLIWGLSVIQPATPNEVLNYLSSTLNDNGLLPESEKMTHYFELLAQHGYIQQVSKRNNLYSSTPRGNERFNLQLINTDGSKRTLKGGQVKGTCHTIEGKNTASRHAKTSLAAAIGNWKRSGKSTERIYIYIKIYGYCLRHQPLEAKLAVLI